MVRMGFQPLQFDVDPAASYIEPVTIEIVQHHPFQKRASRGCNVCGRAKTHAEHQGAPPSMNVLGSGNQFAYQALKKTWQELLTAELERADLPRPVGRILAEGEVTFPDRRRRDQGNHRFFLEKALGDVLTAGGWLEDDDWARYEFGGLSAVCVPQESRTRLMLFPMSADA
jgi:hypothetical protein